MSEFAQTLFLGHAAWLWLVFAGVVVTLLALDLGVVHRAIARSASPRAVALGWLHRGRTALRARP